MKSWIINSMISSNKNSITPIKLLIDDQIVSDQQVVVDKFNSYFTGVGHNLAQNIPQSTVPCHSYLLDSHPLSLFFFPTTSAEVVNITHNFISKKKFWP